MRKILAIVGAGVMLVSVAACGSGTAGDDNGRKEVSFQTWDLKNDKCTPYLEASTKVYEKGHPDVIVKWLSTSSGGYEDELSSQATAGELLDTVDGGNSTLYDLAKASTPFDISRQTPDAEKDYYEGAWESMTTQGNGAEEGVRGLLWYVNDDPTYWNTRLMQKCGFDPSRIPATWDEYFAAGDTIVQSCRDVCLGITMGHNAEDLMIVGVKSFMNGDRNEYTFSDETGVERISRFIELYKKGDIPPEVLDSSWSQAADLFQRGNLVSMAGPAYSVDGSKQNAPDPYKNPAVGPRISSDGKPASMACEMLGISADSKHPDVAADFACSVINEKSQIESDEKASVFPFVEGDLDDDYYKSIDESTFEDEALKITLNQVKDGYGSRPAEFAGNNGYKSFQQQIALAMQGKQTVKEALDRPVEFANEKLAQRATRYSLLTDRRPTRSPTDLNR